MWVLLSLATLTLVVVMAGGYVTTHPGVLQRFVQWPPSVPSDHGIPFESFAVPTPDGVTLHGWWIPATTLPVRGTVVGLHGVASPKTDWASFSKKICPRGYNLVLYDSRGHGESVPAIVSYGVQEENDVATVLDYLAREGKPVDRVVLMGTSMGAVVALRAAAHDPRAIAVIAQSAFLSFPETVDYQTRPWLGPFRRPVARAAFFGARLWADSDAYLTANTLDAARAIHLPALIIHGTADWLVPPSHSERLHAAIPSPDKHLLMVDDGTHESLWYGDYPEYERVLYAFLDRVTASASANGGQGE